MPQGDKSAYTDKQKRQAAHIEESYEERGVPTEEAEARAWATVNKQDGGGKKSGSGRGQAVSHESSRTHEQRSEAAKKGWETRRHKAAA
jgi:plasmid stabilization system protein ParE